MMNNIHVPVPLQAFLIVSLVAAGVHCRSDDGFSSVSRTEDVRY